MSDFSVEIKGRTLEYLDEQHIYLVNGVIVPSITTILGQRFGRKYDGVPEAVLKKAAEAGTRVHEAIETFIKTGYETPIPEVEGFKILQEENNFKVVESELPVILEDKQGNPIAAGRLDLVLEMNGVLGGADIKRTSRLDLAYLISQLNLYKISYEQSYGREWAFLAGLHLRENIHSWVNIPIEPKTAHQIIYDYFNEETEE